MSREGINTGQINSPNSFPIPPADLPPSGIQAAAHYSQKKGPVSSSSGLKSYIHNWTGIHGIWIYQELHLML